MINRFPPKTMYHKRITTYGIRKPDPGFGLAQKYGRDKPVNGIPIPPSYGIHY